MEADLTPSSAEKPKRKQVFFDIAIADIPIGRIVFELWFDKVPKTCENFRCLCTGEKGVSATTGASLHYKGTLMHRIIKGFMVQGGDFTKFNGTGGESIYGGKFEDEDLSGVHDRPGLLSMANAGKDTNGSQFFVTCARAPHLDGNHVIFGQLMSGKSVLRFMEREPVVDEKTHRPGLVVKVVDCGELALDDYVAKSEMETTNQEKKRRRHSSSSSGSDTSSSSDNSSRRRKSRSNRKSKSSKRSKYSEEDDRRRRDDHSPSKRPDDRKSEEKAPKEPPQPRVDAQGREVRGRGAVSEKRRPSQDNRSSSYSTYGNSRSRDYGGRNSGGRPEDSQWSKIDDRDRNRQSYGRDGGYDQNSGDRYRDDGAERRTRGGYGQRRDDRSDNDRSYRRAERTVEYVPTSRSHASSSESPAGSSANNTGNGDALVLPPRTLVSYSNVVSQAPPPSSSDKESVSPKKTQEEVKERAGSPEQSRRRSPSPHRANDHE